MISDASPSSPLPALPSRAARRPHYLRAAGIVTSLAAFAAAFNPDESQLLVDGLWFLALGLWISEMRACSGGALLSTQPDRGDLVPIAALIAVFAAAWLPFYDNWRWAYTSDSLAWFTFARAAARGTLVRNILSVRGVDDNFTYIHSVASNGLMFLFEPSLFWHRAGKLVVSCLSLGAIYAYFTLTLGRWWAFAIVLTTAVNYVFLWFSYVSYGHIDSFIFYFLTLLLGTLIWRRPEYLGQWMLCGLVGGCALFFTQTSWSAVGAVGLALAGCALVRHRFDSFAVYGLSFLLVAAPILLQLRDVLAMTARQAHSTFAWSYLREIFITIMRVPYDWTYCRIGVQGPFLPWPLGTLYLGGLALSVLALVPPVRRALRIPSVAAVLVALLLWDAVLLTLTNNAYSQPSTKRVYNLIPLHAFFALLPFYVLHAWSGGRKVLRGATVAATVSAIGVYAAGNLQLLRYPVPGVYGYTVFDVMVELRQRFPQRPLLLFSSRPQMDEFMLGADSPVDTLYHIGDTLAVKAALTSQELESACATDDLICYEPQYDTAALRQVARAARACLHQLPLFNSGEAKCFTCEPRPCEPPLTEAELSALLP